MRKKAAECLLKTEAVFFRPEEPFTWASGIKSPIYCDNRLVLSDPEARQVIEEGMIELIKKEFPQAEALFGTATAGIAHAATKWDCPWGMSDHRPRITAGAAELKDALSKARRWSSWRI